MGPPMVPPSINEINSNSMELNHLQRLQSQQDAKISEIGSMLGPLSPSGHVPGLSDDAAAYFDPQSTDFDQFFDIGDLSGGHDFADGSDFDFAIDTDPNHQNQASLHPGHVMSHTSLTNTPSPAGTEEISRDDLRLENNPSDRGTKRQRIA
ncbi:hypothetical protein FAUST_366 [Fusarium austroamericanum]|uniref:Uncharacterized protein n=1 Tax=Fusarium austroamericanum TaxID=282268 RepID=A0AAN6HKR4_FUSAU|nr:hypothetical protein FAUST_366 [Fusarium austroamericanum]